MLIKMYTVSDAANVINKTLGASFDVEVTLRKDFNIFSPELVLLVTHAQAMAFNYIAMPELERFYFVDRVDSVNSRLYRFMLSCDVLETYKAQIMAAEGKFERDIAAGDYGNVTAESGVYDFTDIKSDVTFEQGSSILVTTVEVQNG